MRCMCLSLLVGRPFRRQWVCRAQLCLLFDLLADLFLASALSACQNPLFMAHWFSSGGPPQALNADPTVSVSLRLCPAYNGVASCCPQAFEPEQNMHFHYWREILEAKLMRVRQSRDAVAQLQGSDVYNVASAADRQQHSRALAAYDAVLDPASHAGCWASLLTYVAGMICFGCSIDWEQSVDMSRAGKIMRVLLSTDTCAQIWDFCSSFGGLALKLRQSVLDSRLALMQTTAFENLDMLYDQQALCDWMHNAIAMHPFTTPLEAEREATRPNEIKRRLTGASQDLASEQGYDAMKAGEASGFDTAWNGVPGFTGAAHGLLITRLRAGGLLSLLIIAAGLTA